MRVGGVGLMADRQSGAPRLALQVPERIAEIVTDVGRIAVAFVVVLREALGVGGADADLDDGSRPPSQS